MEGSEESHLRNEKVSAVKREFGKYFCEVFVSVHILDDGTEVAGKGSNVNHACREISNVLRKRGDSFDEYVVTVLDSDALIPELYVWQLEESIISMKTRGLDPYMSVFCPPILFNINSFDVPGIIRGLADKVDYWDTDFESIGEDLHMSLKCFFKTNGSARMVPILVPISYMNVRTQTFKSNIAARYIQAKRHYLGIADSGYTLDNTAQQIVRQVSGRTSNLAQTTSLLRYLKVCYFVVETHGLPATSGWIMLFAVLIFSLLLNYDGVKIKEDDKSSTLNLLKFTCVLSSVASLPLFFCGILYEVVYYPKICKLLQNEKKIVGVEGVRFKSWDGYVRVELDKRPTKVAWRMLDYLLLPASAFLFMTIPSFHAMIVRMIKKKDAFVVSQKCANTHI
ncbi:hypothetical protein HK098_005254 [Nowakowskiella sp. JEL0407]|nr:hypothetical protein HK098_005254 [Nowakowskiella sp. JEL0407]